MVLTDCTNWRFNTQPPEGGWSLGTTANYTAAKFQHTAARRRLGPALADFTKSYQVSTHSRPKAAGLDFEGIEGRGEFGFNTQPPEGGWHGAPLKRLRPRCFNTQPPEGGWVI